MRKEVIFILGMHRSGTSAVAGAFGKLGAELPNDLMGAQPTNPLGFFDSNSAVYLNDQILESLGTNWRDWRPISPHWFQTEAAQEFKLKDLEGQPFLINLAGYRRVIEFSGAVTEIHFFRHLRLSLSLENLSFNQGM